MSLKLEMFSIVICKGFSQKFYISKDDLMSLTSSVYLSFMVATISCGNIQPLKVPKKQMIQCVCSKFQKYFKKVTIDHLCNRGICSPTFDFKLNYMASQCWLIGLFW